MCRRTWLIGVQPLFQTSSVVIEDPLFITRDDLIKKRSFWLCKGKEERTSKRDNFCRSFKSWDTHFSIFLTFPTRFKSSKTALELTPSSSAIPRTVCDGSDSTRVLKSSSGITVGLPLRGSSSMPKSLERNFSNQCRTVRSLTLSLPSAWLIFRAVSAAL